MKSVEKEWSKKCEAVHKEYETLLQEKEKELQLKDQIINSKEVELTQKALVKREEIVSLINQIKELESKLEAKIEDVLLINLSTYIHHNILFFNFIIRMHFL